MDDRRPLSGRCQHRLQQRERLLAIDGANPTEPGCRGQTTVEDRWQRRFVELDDEVGPWHQPSERGKQDPQPFGERLGQVPAGALVDERPFAAMQPDPAGQGNGPGHGQFEGPGIPVEGGGQLVQVLGPESGGAGRVVTRSVDEAPCLLYTSRCV